jgi:hypothetical protein
MVVENLTLYPGGQRGDKVDAGPAGLGFVKCSGFTHIPGIAGVLQCNTVTPTLIRLDQLDRQQ